jgi:hypothetical protein
MMLALWIAAIFAAVGSSEVEGKFGNSSGRFFRDVFQALHDTRHDLVLDARVEALGILAHNDKIQVAIARFNPR